MLRLRSPAGMPQTTRSLGLMDLCTLLEVPQGPRREGGGPCHDGSWCLQDKEAAGEVDCTDTLLASWRHSTRDGCRKGREPVPLCSVEQSDQLLAPADSISEEQSRSGGLSEPHVWWREFPGHWLMHGAAAQLNWLPTMWYPSLVMMVGTCWQPQLR